MSEQNLNEQILNHMTIKLSSKIDFCPDGFWIIYYSNHGLYPRLFLTNNNPVIFTESMKILSDYEELMNDMAEVPSGDVNELRSTAEGIIDLFINRKVMIYNDLDPNHQLSEFYELDIPVESDTLVSGWNEDCDGYRPGKRSVYPAA